jgi:hypothetical protein
MTIEIVFQISILHQLHHHIRGSNPRTNAVQLNDVMALKLSRTKEIGAFDKVFHMFIHFIIDAS